LIKTPAAFHLERRAPASKWTRL